MEKLEITQEQIIDSPPEEVWQVITNPDLFSEWMFVPGVGENHSPLSLRSKIYWKDD